MPSILPFRKPPAPRHLAPYAQGYIDGLKDGSRFASLRFFWFGVAMGLVLATAVVLAVLFYMGATK